MFSWRPECQIAIWGHQSSLWIQKTEEAAPPSTPAKQWVWPLCVNLKDMFRDPPSQWSKCPCNLQMSTVHSHTYTVHGRVPAWATELTDLNTVETMIWPRDWPPRCVLPSTSSSSLCRNTSGWSCEEWGCCYAGFATTKILQIVTKHARSGGVSVWVCVCVCVCVCVRGVMGVAHVWEGAFTRDRFSFATPSRSSPTRGPSQSYTTNVRDTWDMGRYSTSQYTTVHYSVQLYITDHHCTAQ